MVQVGDVIAALEKFELDLIDKQWCDDIWESDFTSCPDHLPDDFSANFSSLSYCDIIQVIVQADNIIRLWLNEHHDTTVESDSHNSCATSPSWTSLRHVKYRALLSVIYFYTYKGQINNQDAIAIQTCMKATSFYFTLLTIPGSDIYKVFHVTLFETCLHSLTLHKYLEIATGKMVKKRKVGGDSDDEFLSIDETLTLQQQQIVVKLLNEVLSAFQELVKKFSFKKYPEVLNVSLTILAELTRIERNSSLQEFFSNNDKTSFCLFSKNAYLTMKCFCSDMHGTVPELLRLVLYYLMPNLTLIGGPATPEMAKFSTKELTNIRNNGISFITQNIITMGECSHLGLKVLIQQICFNMIDRADYRAKACEMIVLLLCKLPMELYYLMVKWIFYLSLMEGAHHRVIGLELLSRLILMKPGITELSNMTKSFNQQNESQSQSTVLQNESESQIISDTGSTYSSQERIVTFSEPINYDVPLEYRRAMLAIILDRMRDEAATVRTRALTILADLIGNKTSPSIRQLFQEIFIKPYRETVCIDKEMGKENDFMNRKCLVAALEKVRHKQVNLTLIPGGKVILKKVFEQCLDETVSVRKAAVLVTSRIFKFSYRLITNSWLELLGRHCRDPALSIRKETVVILTELMVFFPQNESLMRLWVEEVVPQITDREIRVQEEVLKVLTEILLNNLMTFEQTKSPKEELPWKLIHCIALQKKISFLVAACALWSKSGLLSQNVIRKLKTHIGTRNDDPCWVFLSSISEYVDIEKPEDILTHYLGVISQKKSEAPTAHLVLRTLYNCWHKLKKDEQETLQTDMHDHLESFSLQPSLVGLTVDIVSSITVVTAEDELTGKKQVAEWAEETIQACELHLGNCLGAVESQTFDCNSCITATSLVGALAGILSGAVKESLFTILYDSVMRKTTGNNRCWRKMQAIAIIALGKMALRSGFFARSLVAGFSQLLSTSSDPVLLNNIMVVIADIGERYANLIEPMIPSICVCLKSPHKTVTETTLGLLIELLQEDYLKARGALVFHLLSLVGDSDRNAVNMVKYYFTSCLLARHPYRMYQLLLPAMFHFNNYNTHPDYPKLEMEVFEQKAFDLTGAQSHQKRMNIYRFMISYVPEMVKMKCLHFICITVLNGVADSVISIENKNGEQLLFDALRTLLLKEIKVEYNELVRDRNQDGEEENNQNQRENPIYKLGKQMFTVAQRKEIIETIVPICCKLKKKLLDVNRKLLPYLYKFVRELVKDYKNDIDEIFKKDQQFGTEILHEINYIAKAHENEGEELEESTNKKDNNGDIGTNAVESQRASGRKKRGRKKSGILHAETINEDINGDAAQGAEMIAEWYNEATTDQVVPVAVLPNEVAVDCLNTHDPTSNNPLSAATTVCLSKKGVTYAEPSETGEVEVTMRTAKRRVREPSDLIEEYDEAKHGAVRRRRNSEDQWRMEVDESPSDQDAQRQINIQAQIERANSTSSSSSKDSEVSLNCPAEESAVGTPNSSRFQPDKSKTSCSKKREGLLESKIQDSIMSMKKAGEVWERIQNETVTSERNTVKELAIVLERILAIEQLKPNCKNDGKTKNVESVVVYEKSQNVEKDFETSSAVRQTDKTKRPASTAVPRVVLQRIDETDPNLSTEQEAGNTLQQLQPVVRLKRIDDVRNKLAERDINKSKRRLKFQPVVMLRRISNADESEACVTHTRSPEKEESELSFRQVSVVVEKLNESTLVNMMRKSPNKDVKHDAQPGKRRESTWRTPRTPRISDIDGDSRSPVRTRDMHLNVLTTPRGNCTSMLTSTPCATSIMDFDSTLSPIIEDMSESKDECQE